MTYDEAKADVLALLPALGSLYYWRKINGDRSFVRVRLVGTKAGGIVCFRSVSAVRMADLSFNNGVEMPVLEFWKRLANGRLVHIDDVRRGKALIW